MGFLSPYSKTEKVDLGDGFWAELRIYLPTNDATAAHKAMLNVIVKQTADNPTPEVATEFDQGAYLTEVVARALIAWNLTDANDVVLPSATLEERRTSVAQLPFWAVKEMAEVVKDEKRSGKEAETFPAQPVGGDTAGNVGAA